MGPPVPWSTACRRYGVIRSVGVVDGAQIFTTAHRASACHRADSPESIGSTAGIELSGRPSLGGYANRQEVVARGLRTA
jgi:hypothetical protein